MFIKSEIAGVLNAIIQTSAIISANFFGVMWGMYLVMLMMGYMTFMQTVAAGSLFSGFVKNDEQIEKIPRAIPMLVSILYLASAYQVYLLGFYVFSGIMFSHTTIYLLTNIFGALRDD